MDRVANSTPIVDLESRLNSLRVNLLKRLDLPTPESPISTTGKMSVWRGGRVGGSAVGHMALTLEEELKKILAIVYLGEEINIHHIHRSPC